jgi:hypothetical protein
LVGGRTKENALIPGSRTEFQPHLILRTFVCQACDKVSLKKEGKSGDIEETETLFATSIGKKT